MNQSEPNTKAILTRRSTLRQVLRRLTAMGFKEAANGRYVNPAAQANIQEVAWRGDNIEDDRVWLLVTARQPFAHAAAASERCAQRRQAKFERKLHLAKEYWLRTIQPRIQGRALRGVELYVASDAYPRLKRAQENAVAWNNTEQGKRWPVPANALADLNSEEFCEPQALCESGNPPPEQKRGIDRLLENFDHAFHTVTFEEIRASNRESSGRLQLLPPMGQKRKGRNDEKSKQDDPLSLKAIQKAVREYLHAHTPQLTQHEYERDQERTQRLVKQGALARYSGGEPQTYQEWQSDRQKEIDDCMSHSRVSLQTLCALRWERFERLCDARQHAAKTLRRNLLAAKAKRGKKLRDKHPSSAASSPKTAGKPEK